MFRSEGVLMEFRLLGELEVWHDGRALELGGPRQRAVLAALLLRANAVATVDYLCDAVWRRLPASPATNLRTYVAGLRRCLRHDRYSQPSRRPLFVPCCALLCVRRSRIPCAHHVGASGGPSRNWVASGHRLVIGRSGRTTLDLRQKRMPEAVLRGRCQRWFAG